MIMPSCERRSCLLPDSAVRLAAARSRNRKNTSPHAENAQSCTKLIGTANGMPPDTAAVLDRQYTLFEAADRRHQLGPEALHQMGIAPIMILEEVNAVSRRLHGQIGHVDRDRFGKVDMLL